MYIKLTFNKGTWIFSFFSFPSFQLFSLSLSVYFFFLFFLDRELLLLLEIKIIRHFLWIQVRRRRIRKKGKLYNEGWKNISKAGGRRRCITVPVARGI